MLLLVVHIRGGLYYVHIAGGSSQNQLLCQMTADATLQLVIAGPVEATALGDALMKWIAMGVSALLPRQAP
jgi:sugar (pentulose or hexulose) kinase